jgi:hypothetical protein
VKEYGMREFRSYSVFALDLDEATQYCHRINRPVTVLIHGQKWHLDPMLEPHRLSHPPGKMSVCPTCAGSGYQIDERLPEGEKPCSHCNGLQMIFVADKEAS